ncbi:RHS repeat protein [Rhizobacter sp. J219]|uniref:RHS repeat protein n=1 Tax=Rhizobacter sp. J219 TaxID=2898430 RepID=UPI00215102DF|nr:RHS repeat protein [Rhizobacter sp. J219]MCR5881400.1 RHS repeat protein [Rhizobacter sp. J219]
MKKILFVAAMVLTPCWAQEGVSQVTIAVKPQLFYSAEWTSPVLLRCASIGECAANAAANNLAQRQAAGERALSFQITNLRPSSQTLNGIPAGYLGDTELVSLNAQGEQVTSRWTGAWRASAGADCPNDGFDWRSVTESPIPNQVVYCARIVYQPQRPPCPEGCPRSEVGNPIDIATGDKRLRVRDYRDVKGLLTLDRLYASSGSSFNGGQSWNHIATLFGPAYASGGPPACYSSFYKTAFVDPTSGAQSPYFEPYCFEYYSPPGFTGTYASIDNSERIVFAGTAATMTSIDGLGTLIASGAGPTLRYILKRNSFPGLEFFDGTGRLLKRVYANGRQLDYGYQTIGDEHYSRTVLSTVTDNWGRQLSFAYSAAKQLESVTDPAGQTISYGYGGPTAVCQYPGACQRLTSVTYPDGTRQLYHYDEPQHTGQAPPYGRLTGVTDELGSRYATYTYENTTRARALSTELAGGVNRFSVQYSPNSTGSFIGSARVRDPLQSEFTMNFINRGMTSYISGRSQPQGAGSPAASESEVYDSSIHLVRKDGFTGLRTCYGNDLVRHLETTRIEGLSSSADCNAVMAVNAVLPIGSRKVSTEWHPDWRIETRVAEPGRIVTSVYNGQPDPFAGGAVASCAPASALLPDGKPFALLCKRVEQATTDANGAGGFSAVLQAGVPARTTTWTYNQWGQVLTENGPRTDINDTTTYTYYSDTSFTGEGASARGHFMGDLETAANAAGRVTRYTQYNKHGQVLESVDPNGVVTSHTYDLRQRLLSTTVGGQTTNYQYDPVGQLKRVTLPDQSWIGYDYDDAHRQVAVYDHRGNRTDYTLDNAGNRIGEQTTDPSGALKRQLARTIDALGRVQQTTGRE